MNEKLSVGRVEEIKTSRITWHEVPIHVGDTENQGNCVAKVVMGGPGGTSSKAEDVLAMANRIVRAVNTFDQAREALKHSLNYLLNTQRSLGIKDGSDDEFVSTRMCREALAAMEAEPA